jgi:hypothetical protein
MDTSLPPIAKSVDDSTLLLKAKAGADLASRSLARGWLP